MFELRYTLLADGSSDRALIPILTWAVRHRLGELAIQAEWADLGRLRRAPRELTERIEAALQLYPCDLLFVHRDAERMPHAIRHAEIMAALDQVRQHNESPPAVCVVPVRMQEAWLLFNEAAIRLAAGNPHGRQPIELPRMPEIERLPDPKENLRQLIRTASGLSGRRLQSLQIRPQRVAELIDDFTPLRALSAFQVFEAELADVIARQGWDRNTIA